MTTTKSVFLETEQIVRPEMIRRKAEKNEGGTEGRRRNFTLGAKRKAVNKDDIARKIKKDDYEDVDAAHGVEAMVRTEN